MFKRLRSRLSVFCLRRGRRDINLGIATNRRCCLFLPKALIEQLKAGDGDSLNYNSDDGKLIITQKRKLRKLPNYDLNMLLTEHKQILPFPESEYEAWDIQKPKGSEML